MLTTVFVNRTWIATKCTLNNAGQRECLPTGSWSAPLPKCIGRALSICIAKYNSHFHLNYRFTI